VRANRAALLTSKARGCQARLRVLGGDRHAQTKAAGKAEVTIECVLKEYARIAFADIAQAYDGESNFLPVAKMPEDIRRALAGVEITDLYGDGEQIGQLKKVRFAQKVPALDSLARYLGMFRSAPSPALDCISRFTWARVRTSLNPRSRHRPFRSQRIVYPGSPARAGAGAIN
jgi:Terminase small subunit